MSAVPQEDSALATPVELAMLAEKTSVGDEMTPSPEDALAAKPASAYISIVIFCLLIAFGGFVFGFDTGTISGFVNMTDYTRRFGVLKDGVYSFPTVRTALIVSIFNIGCAVGGILLSRVGDMYGRKVGLMSSMVIYVVGITIQIAASSKWYQLCIGRAITGLSVGMVTVIAPLFISESSPKALRGTLVVCFQLFITFGIFLGYCVCYGTKKLNNSAQWRVPLGLCYLWAIFLVVGMLLMPESPRYLVEKKEIEAAKNSIARSNKISPEDPAVYSELQLIQAGIDREALAGTASWTDLITGKPAIFRRVAMGVILNSLQQLTGNNYFFYYGTTIFQAVGLKDSFETSIILGVVNFASTFAGIYAIDKFGRRMCLMTGSACMFVCFIIYSTIGSVHLYKDGEYDNNNTHAPSGKAMIFVTCLYIFFFASTWAGGTYAIISESYPLRIRSKAMSIATGANWIWGFLISFFTPYITKAIHFYYGYVFTGCLLFSFFYVYFMVNETKGLTLEEVDELYAQGILPWKSAKWVPPSAEEMATTANYAEELKAGSHHA